MPEIFRDEEERDEKQREIREQAAQILQLPPHHDRPRRVGRMMQARPEKRADGYGKKVGEPEEPRMRGLAG